MPELSRRHLLAGGGALGLGAAGAAGAGALTTGWRPFGPDVGEARAPVHRARGGNGMNVVLIVIDSLRTDHIGAYGSSVRTPNLDAFARSATIFTRAFAEALPTIPVRRAVHTGLRTYPARGWRHVPGNPRLPGWQPIPEAQVTLGQLLGQVGYQTLLLADTPPMMNPSMNFTLGYGAYEWFRGSKTDRYRMPGSAPQSEVLRYVLPRQRGSADERDVRQYVANLTAMPREGDRAAPRLFSRARESLGELKRMQPFLLVVDTFEPHEPFLPPMRYVEPYSDGYHGFEPTRPTYRTADYLEEHELERMRALYAGEITFVDHWVGRVFDGLAEHGLDESTMVIVLTDHGILLGDNGYTGKPPDAPYPAVTDIALMVRHPERGHGDRSDLNASTHDVAPTVLSSLDVDLDGPLDGGDLLGPDDRVARRKTATALYGSALWVRDDRWMLVGRDYGLDAELYDFRDDPDLERDVSAQNRDVVNRLLREARRQAGGSIPRYNV